MLTEFLDLLADLFLLGRPSRIEKLQEELQEKPLDEMIDNSRLIVVGKVGSIEEIPTRKNARKSAFDEVAVATIEIEQIILGSYEGKQIDITYYPRLSFEARFLMSERCIFFIGERNLIVQGYAGKIPIEKDKVEILHIRGEQKRQMLKDFLRRIEDSRSRQATTQNP